MRRIDGNIRCETGLKVVEVVVTGDVNRDWEWEEEKSCEFIENRFILFSEEFRLKLTFEGVSEDEFRFKLPLEGLLSSDGFRLKLTLERFLFASGVVGVESLKVFIRSVNWVEPFMADPEEKEENDVVLMGVWVKAAPWLVVDNRLVRVGF